MDICAVKINAFYDERGSIVENAKLKKALIFAKRWKQSMPREELEMLG